MLGTTAGGLFWMFRYLERSENTARLVRAGVGIGLSRSGSAEDEWRSILNIAGMSGAYAAKYDTFDAATVIDYMLRDRANPFSVLAIVEAARNNARLVRTALSREVFEATNECWIELKALMARPIPEADLYDVLGSVRLQSALVRGSLHGTIMRTDIFDFASIGTFLERASNIAGILNVKYYVLLPTAVFGGTQEGNVQWETILRSVAALRTYRRLNHGSINPHGIADFLIRDERMPQSMAFCINSITHHLGNISAMYEREYKSYDDAVAIRDRLKATSVSDIFDTGLLDFVQEYLRDIRQLSNQIEQDFRFYR